MEAANRGAKEAGGLSAGANIKLPHEQQPNPYLDKVVTFYYFFVRKVILVKYSCAFVVLLLAHQVPLSAGAFLLGNGMEQLGPLVFLLYAVILAVLGAALWRKWKGARRAGIVLTAAGLALALPAISSAVVDGRAFAILREGLQIIVRVIAIHYLSQEPVKEWFAVK